MKKTLENLTKAFVWESQARNRYTLYASAAKKQWYLQIADIFLQTAEQEKEHAEWFFKMIQIFVQKEWIDMPSIDIETTTMIKFGDTITNLKTSIEWENEEYSELYPEFAKVAQEEWYPEFTARIRSIMRSEMHHEERYKKLYDQLINETLWNKSENVEWMCTKCGYIHKGKTPPEKCPSCDHDKTYYVVKCEEY